jgi:hypothetical protein
MTARVSGVSTGGARREDALGALLTDTDRERVLAEAYAWIKSLRHVPVDGRSFRERFAYRDASLWWFTELYLHKTRHAERAIATLMALDRAVEAWEPAALRLTSEDPVEQRAALAFGAARGVAVSLDSKAAAWPDRRWASYQIGLTATLSRLRRRPRPLPRMHPRVAAFVHTAFWRRNGHQAPADESYIGPVLAALEARLGAGGLAYVGVGPRRNFRARRWWDPVTAGLPSNLVVPIEQIAPRERLHQSLGLWKARHRLAAEVITPSAMREAARVLGCDLWSVLEPELTDVALLQWPWSARAMDEAGAALDAIEPQVVATYAEAGGWGRALVLEARRRGIPSVGIQHGFIYRHWLNYRHEPDEMQPLGTDGGFPHPDRTLLFDGYAERHLRDLGHLPTDTLRVTGSPRLDALSARCRSLAADREAIRASLGVAADGRVAVLAAKLSEVREHLPELFSAVMATTAAQLIVKTHPAETPDEYRALAAGLDRISVVPADADLAWLLVAADAVVTRNSTVAVDGLTLGIPALVIGLPNNLSPFVEAGAMLGADRGAMQPAVAAVLYDRKVREGLIEGGRAFVSRAGTQSDGHAAERAVTEILALGPPAPVGGG